MCQPVSTHCLTQCLQWSPCMSTALQSVRKPPLAADMAAVATALSEQCCSSLLCITLHHCCRQSTLSYPPLTASHISMQVQCMACACNSSCAVLRGGHFWLSSYPKLSVATGAIVFALQAMPGCKYSHQLVQISIPHAIQLVIFSNHRRASFVSVPQVYHLCLVSPLICNYPSFWRACCKVNNHIVLSGDDRAMLSKLGGLSNAAAHGTIVTITACCQALQTFNMPLR